jgi:type I restriction enzyme R subunit
MVFYAKGLQAALNSPTIVVITDRNDLDDQLFARISKCKDFLRQTPLQAEKRKLSDDEVNNGTNTIGLMNWLAVREANGIIFTTMQKFEEGDEPLRTCP